MLKISKISNYYNLMKSTKQVRRMGSLAGVQYVGRPLIIIAKMREFQFVAISANN